MSLRARLSIAMAVLVAAAIAVAGALTVVSADRELRNEVDDFLETRADQIRSLDLDFDNGNGRGRGNGPRTIGAALDQADAFTQILDADGDVVVPGQVDLPVGDKDRAIARGDSQRDRYRTIEIDDTDYRMLTVSLPNGAIQIARDLSEIERALDGLRRNAIALGLGGAVAAALIAWVLASRFARPIAQLTEAAGHVAETQDLSASIDIGGRDEVGRLAGSFNTMLAALDTSRQQQRRLVMDASHELRTPLTSLRTNVDVLRRSPDLSSEMRSEVLAAVGGELDELTALVTELVDLATESNAAEEPLVDTDLGGLVDDVVERFRRRTNRSISVSIGALDETIIRPSSVDRAISNLIENALKFSADDSAVDVSVVGSRVAVRDRGPGIEPADRALVFDRFYRSVETRTMPGSGLGLSIVKEIVDAHDGTVFIEDPPDGPGVVIGFDLG